MALGVGLPGAQDVTEFRQLLRRERRAIADQADVNGGIRAWRIRADAHQVLAVAMESVS
jgi:hypothetical protein